MRIDEHDGARAVAHRPEPRWARRLAAIARALHRVLGAPDYDAYLAHLREHHPGELPLSRGEFTRERLRERYERVGGRCC